MLRVYSNYSLHKRKKLSKKVHTRVLMPEVMFFPFPKYFFCLFSLLLLWAHAYSLCALTHACACMYVSVREEPS